MKTFTTPDTMRAWSRAARAEGHTIAVVPTMGALHEGHIALIETARSMADGVIVTIFVNPLQFNESTDFDLYPRPIDDDVAICTSLGVDAVYAPTAATMYPTGFQTHVEPGDLADRLEGPMRPGHFRGVTTVVTKLLTATVADYAIFGQKDYQQLAIVKRLVVDLDLGVDIIGVPTVREPDGLALSSRNRRLTPEQRAAAPAISSALFAARTAVADGETDPVIVVNRTRSRIDAEPHLSAEYVELVDALTLTPVEVIDRPCAVLVAAWCGEVRLIDNLVISPPQI
ncbi:MAG: pantoate--beta-alanine ligase [Ilumatobacter coccineus]|uniref:Pantothenate synthetase n=1 Tax=Ilumatobacter coccineus TaxID=467094 RepID=A0A2G6KE88_9ACTN|nr:MAG: pantoate--beta-alanine ligase [Ilumatobacter coccineus]